MTLRIPCAILLATALLPALLSAKGEDASKPSVETKQLALSIVPEKNSVMIGEPFAVTVNVENKSGHEFPRADPSWWFIVLTVAAKDGTLLARSVMPIGHGRPVPQIPAHDKYTGTFLLPASVKQSRRFVYNSGDSLFKQPGEYVITAHVEFWIENETEDHAKHSAAVAAGITVTAADNAKMGALIDELGRRAIAVWNERSTSYPQEAGPLYKLMQINDERVVPWLARLLRLMPPGNYYSKAILTDTMSNFHNDVVEKAMKDAEAPAPAESPAANAAPAPGESDIKKALESGDPWLVRRLVEQGADIRPFSGKESEFAKFWTAPLDTAAVSPELKIEAPRQIKRGEYAPIHIEFKNTGDNTRFVNPAFDREYYSPAGILLYDENKRCIGDLFDFSASDLSGGIHPGKSNPGWIDSGQVRATDDRFKIPAKILYLDEDDSLEFHRENPPIRLANPEAKKRLRGIAPGHYYLQFVYWLGFVAPPPDAPGNAIAALVQPFKFPVDFDTNEKREEEIDRYYENPVWRIPLYRSNIVPIEVQ